jgi:predicted DNA-binding protein YlxM (UPF0122 family)
MLHFTLSEPKRIFDMKKLGAKALKTIRLWQKRSKSGRCTLAELARTVGVSQSSIRSCLKRGVLRQQMRKTDANLKLVEAKTSVAARAYDTLSKPERRCVSLRTAQRKTMRKRVLLKEAKTRQKAQNRVLPSEHKLWATNSDSDHWRNYSASQQRW